jgi:type 1 fimbriae regulatory protein FimB/type 1 fimbriae regulatory protein FimE
LIQNPLHLRFKVALIVSRLTVSLLRSIDTVEPPATEETMENTAAEMSASTAVNETVRRSRPREYLVEHEIEKLIKAASDNRWGHRDATAILIAYRHGLRSSELVALRWDDLDFTTGKIHIRRSKGGQASVHPLGARELRALRRLKRETPDSLYVFVSERLAPLSVAGYQRMVARAGEAAGFPFAISSHALRHSCGYKLANDHQDTRAIQHYLGHKSINSTVRYTQLAPDRFKGFWRD